LVYPGFCGKTPTAASGSFEPNAFIRIGATRSVTITDSAIRNGPGT